MAAGFYRLMRERDSGGNQDPVVVGGGRAVITSRQVEKPFLCWGCEQSLGSRESWILRQCARPGRFQLRTRLTQNVPLVLDGPGVATYNLETAYPEAAGPLAFFAASVLWRAGATSWPTGHGPIDRIQLGPYLETLRAYLVGAAEWLPGIAIVMFVDSEPSPTPILIFPYGGKHGATNRFEFAVPGLRFVVFVGKATIGAIVRLALNTEGPKAAFMESFLRGAFVDGVLGLVAKSAAIGRLASPSPESRGTQ